MTADLEGWVDNARMRQITSEHAAEMVEHGLLHLRHPDKPNRVDQAYTKNMQGLKSLQEAEQ